LAAFEVITEVFLLCRANPFIIGSVLCFICLPMYLDSGWKGTSEDNLEEKGLFEQETSFSGVAGHSQ
jgi:hypothetical protein